jgi:hypothetical protein
VSSQTINEEATKSNGLLVSTRVNLGEARVVHCKREKHHVYIGRNPKWMEESKWGNRFVVGVHGERGECIKLHAQELRARYNREPEQVMRDLDELRGLVIACWCKPRDCHGDILVYLANASTAERERWFALAD